MTWPSAMPGANTSLVVQSGRRWRRMYQNATATASDQPAVEHAARAEEREELAGCCEKVLEVDDEQQELRADERGDDDVDAEVHHPRGVEAARACPRERELQARQVGGGEQHAVGVDAEIGPSSAAVGACRAVRSMSRMSAAPDGDRRVGDVERPEVPAAPVEIDEVDDVAEAGAIDQVADAPPSTRPRPTRERRVSAPNRSA
jgi:hypothetical protein